jgi:hypothetical protein
LFKDERCQSLSEYFKKKKKAWDFSCNTESNTAAEDGALTACSSMIVRL